MAQIEKRLEKLILNGCHDLNKGISSFFVINLVQNIVVQKYNGLANPPCFKAREPGHVKGKYLF